MNLYDPVNPDWEEAEADLPGWEPWEDVEAEPDEVGGCDYCGAPDIRDAPDPFGGKPCCDACFNQLIGGERDDPPWRSPRVRP